MSLYKRKDSQYYWMTFNVNGKKIFESTGTTNKKLAEKINAKRVTEIAEGKWFPNEAKKRTFKDLKQRYMAEYSQFYKTPKSTLRDVSSFKHLEAFLTEMKLADITPTKLSEYKKLRRCSGAKPATLARELEVLRHALNLAVREWEWLDRNPFEKVRIDKVNNRTERWLTTEEENRLLSVSLHWLKEIIIFALNTGMRQSEILDLKWSEVDLFRKSLTVLVTKNKEKRTIPINQTVLDLLKQKSRVQSITGYVFCSEAASRIDARNLLRAYFSARKKAGLEDVRFHDLRHTFATRMVQNGVDLYTVKELMGHKTITMTIRYAHHNPESLRHGVEVLDKISGDSSSEWLRSGYGHQ